MKADKALVSEASLGMKLKIQLSYKLDLLRKSLFDTDHNIKHKPWSLQYMFHLSSAVKSFTI